MRDVPGQVVEVPVDFVRPHNVNDSVGLYGTLAGPLTVPRAEQKVFISFTLLLLLSHVLYMSILTSRLSTMVIERAVHITSTGPCPWMTYGRISGNSGTQPVKWGG